jgi:hypothetical protein
MEKLLNGISINKGIREGMVVLGVAVDPDGETVVIWEYDFQKGKAYDTIMDRTWSNNTDYGPMLRVDKTDVLDYYVDFEEYLVGVKDVLKKFKESGWVVYDLTEF